MTAIVILGAAVWADGPSPTLRRRSLHGARVFAAGKGSCIIACGGLGQHPPSEAAAMHALLIDANVPDDAIHLEAHSTTTYENLRNAKAILQTLGIANICIVTDSYHGPRAVMVARALGLKATYDAPTNTGTPYLRAMRRVIHEALAMALYATRLPFWIRRDKRDQNWLRDII